MTLDRYVLTKFIVPFIYCLFGFMAIWFIFNLADNLPEFLEGKASFGVLLAYYKSQIPEIIVMSLPVSMLLALLYSLAAMSRSNELISMLGAGRSVYRILMPLFGMGILLTIVCGYFNFEGGPHAQATGKQMLRDIKRGAKREENLSGHLFRNRDEFRTWYIRKFWLSEDKLTGVQIVQQDKDGNIVEEWYADTATFDPVTKQWRLSVAKQVVLDVRGNIKSTTDHWEYYLRGYSETPWRIRSSVMKPDFLSVYELRDYLHHNKDFSESRLAPYRTHLHYRWTLPMACFVVILLAAPMGIVYSRRGILTGVAAAIALFFSLVFFSSLAISLGKGAKIPPLIAAWGPIVVYFLIGLVLLWYRNTNRDLPKIKIPGF